ncbi:MAG: hypothetical protein ACTSW1_18035 [Candidatus Hodarchaeales archaeon]
MSKEIPKQLIYSLIDDYIIDLDSLKDEILEDQPFYARMSSGIIPIEPLGGYTRLFFVYNDLESGKKFDKELAELVRKYTPENKVK